MQMTSQKPGAWRAMASGAGVVLRRQRVLWWLFLANFITGVIAVLPVRLTLGRLLDHSLASQSLVDHFDLSAYLEVISSPQFSFGIFKNLSLLTSVIFVSIVLFAEAGVIQEFRQAAGLKGPARGQTGGEFFQACGAFLGRMARLLLWSLAPLAVLVLLFMAVLTAIQPIVDNSPSETTGIKLTLGSALILFLLFAAVRVWVSMAQIEMVAKGERVTRRILFGSARRLALGNFGKLYAIQFVTAIALLGVTVMGLVVWVKLVPPASVGLAFVVSELTLLLMLACRLWQQASLVIWYERWASLQPTPVEQPLSQPHEEVIVAATAPQDAPTAVDGSDGKPTEPA
jgi:hypothetical protein